MVTFGYQPRTSGPLATPERLRRYAIRGEELGYDALSVTDHIALPIEFNSTYPYNESGKMTAELDHDMYDALSVLGLWAGITSRVVLQTSVLVLPYRHPVTTAKTIACLDVIAGGRLEVGIGAGWLKEEFDILQLPGFEHRGKITDEYIQVYRALWTEERPKFDGEFYTLDNVAMLPKPVRKPGIPILIGGISKPALRRAARLGDGWQALRVSADDVREGVATIREHATGIGRVLSPAFEISMRAGMRVTRQPTERRKGEEPIRVFVGTPDEVADQIQAYIDAGTTAFMLDTRFNNADEVDESLELFAQEVMPRFRGQQGIRRT
jgi:probable F420-dependent oxidoreductase